jgi:hypothetical protein
MRKYYSAQQLGRPLAGRRHLRLEEEEEEEEEEEGFICGRRRKDGSLMKAHSSLSARSAATHVRAISNHSRPVARAFRRTCNRASTSKDL